MIFLFPSNIAIIPAWPALFEGSAGTYGLPRRIAIYLCGCGLHPPRVGISTACALSNQPFVELIAGFRFMMYCRLTFVIWAWLWFVYSSIHSSRYQGYCVVCTVTGNLRCRIFFKILHLICNKNIVCMTWLTYFTDWEIMMHAGYGLL